MARTNKIINTTNDEVEIAKETAIALLQNNTSFDVMDMFYTTNLEQLEYGIKYLNTYSEQSWLLSAILLFTLVYDKELYSQSGLQWSEYSKQARERLGLDPRDITEQLSAARFFIKNYNELVRLGFNPSGSNRKLARAERATELCGDVHLVIQHLVTDTWTKYYEWYSSFKTKKIETTEFKRNDIDIKDGSIFIKGIEAIKVSNDLETEEKKRIENYLYQIFDAIKRGYEPAIVPVYDTKEARILVNLRDKYRQGK